MEYSQELLVPFQQIIDINMEQKLIARDSECSMPASWAHIVPRKGFNCAILEKQ